MNYFPVGKKVEKQKYKTIVTDLSTELPSPPFTTTDVRATVLNGEIHVFYKSSHRKYNYATGWTDVRNTPFVADLLRYFSAVTLNGEIHLIGGNSQNTTMHYKWDGNTWTQVSTFPIRFYFTVVIVFEGEIHALGGLDGNTHYKWDGKTWTSVEVPPANFSEGTACVYNDEIHIIGYEGHLNSHYKWDGKTWTSVGTLPINVSTANSAYAVAMNNAIYFYYYNTRAIFKDSAWKVLAKYVYSSGSWSKTAPFEHSVRSSAVVFLDGVHIINYYDGNDSRASHSIENINLSIPID